MGVICHIERTLWISQTSVLKKRDTRKVTMADITMNQIASDVTEIKSSIKALAKLLRKLRTTQDDPDGEKAKARASNNGFNRPLEISDKLRTFLGLADGETISRSDVTRRINAYVTTNGLKHPENGRVIILDEKLTTLLEPPTGLQITFLNIQKYLSPHYAKVPKEPKAPKAPKTEAAPVAAPDTPPAEAAPVKKKPVVKKPVVKA
jgi:chromatin remodeling complex protein RSC6